MEEETRPNRRLFLTSVARKAAYVAPAVLALKAAQRARADFTGCVGPGSACTIDPDCCTGLFCVRPNMAICAGAMNCKCE